MPLSHHMPELAALELLLAVARSGSIGAAAREHGVSQQAASVRLRGLETQLGVGLLSRDPRGSRLTPTGVLVVEWAGSLLDAAASFDQALGSLREDRDAHLDVAASMTIAEHLLPAWLFQLRTRQQGLGQPVTAVRLTATNSDSVIALVASGSAGLGFIEGPSVGSGLRSTVVLTDELVVVVPPGHLWTRRRRPVGPADLLGTALVMREPGSGTRSALELALLGALGRPLVLHPPALELTTNAAVRGAVIAGAGPAVLSSLTVHDDLTAGRLIRVPSQGLALRRRLRAVWRGGPIPPAGPIRDLITLATP